MSKYVVIMGDKILSSIKTKNIASPYGGIYKFVWVEFSGVVYDTDLTFDSFVVAECVRIAAKQYHCDDVVVVKEVVSAVK